MNQQSLPLVTAVIPVYNHESYVAESIRSIMAQTYSNIEVIIINDGSIDGSHDVITTLLPECSRRCARVEYICRENQGLSATLNQALHLAQGTYFTVLASDDVALPERIATLVGLLEHLGAAFAAAFGDALFIDGRGRKVKLDDGGYVSDYGSCGSFFEFYLRSRSVDCEGERFGTYESLVTGNYLPAMSNVLKTAALREAGGWTVGNPLEDWEMWLKLSKKWRFACVRTPVALYRWHDSNTVKTMASRLMQASTALILREKEFCEANCLGSIWQETYCSFVFAQLRDQRVSVGSRLLTLGKSRKWMLFSGTLRKLICKFRQQGAAQR